MRYCTQERLGLLTLRRYRVVLTFDYPMPGSRTVEVTVNLTLRDIYRANVSINARKFRWPIRGLFSMGLLALAAFLFNLLWRLDGQVSGQRPGLVFSLLFVPVFMVYLLLCAPYFAARSLVRNNPNACKPVQWSFSPDRIEAHGPTSDTSLQWSAFLTIRETKDQFLLYVHKHFANVIPKKCFRDSSDLHTFRSLVRASFPGEKILRS